MNSITTYLALGDSYTIGEAVPESGRWPVQLAARLGWAAPTIVAQTGWTTDELSLAIDAAALASTYDRVSLLIGVNNQYRGRTVANYAVEFRVLLDRAIGFAGGDAARVFVVSIPDWGVTAFAARDGRGRGRIGREIDAFNAAARTLCAQHGVAFVDITPTSRDRGGDADMLADDGLHPSSAMYTRWVDDIVHTLPVAAPG
jgi:lysophospholipase L1-like esterase